MKLASHAPSNGMPGTYSSGVWIAPRVTIVFGLQLPRQVAQLVRLAIEEHHVDRSVIGHQLLHLREVELHQAGIVSRLHGRNIALHIDLVLPQPPEIVRRKVEPGAMPCARNASRISRVMSCLNGVCMMPKSVVFVSHMAKPEWCLVVRTTYRIPASFASARPILRVEFARVERLRQVVKEALGVGFVGAGERMGDDHARLRIHGPVDKHAEALIAKPLQPLRLVQRSRRQFLLRGKGRGQ